MTDYWIGFTAGIGTFSLIYWAIFSFYRRNQITLLKKKERENDWLRERYEEMFAEALKATVAHDALLHVLQNRNDEGEEWKR